MQTKIKLRTTAIVVLVFIQGFIFPLSPLAVIAQGDVSQSSTDQVSDTTSTTQSKEDATTNQGPTEPTGADRVEYEFNPETGMWESDKYIWNPATNQTTPKQEQKYSYNPETGRWDTTEWVYKPESGKYVENFKSTPTATSQTTTKPTSATSTADQPVSSPASGQSSDSTINNTGPDSNNQISSSNKKTGTYDNWYNVTISNNIDQNTRSGDAKVIQNTIGGNATTGDASSRADVINLLQSSWGLSDGELTTFTANLTGDTFGDLIVDTGPNSNNQINRDNQTQLTVNNVNDNQIINNINANTVSGDASVSKNTQAGNATTGDATTMVNVINMINSMILSGQSFYGTINIDGNLEGDVLLPQAALDSLIASTGPNSDNQINSSNDTDVELNLNNDTNITNNVNSQATSGDATVSGNTRAGDAATGNASNDTTIVNLVGNDITAENSLLVFVNVFGEWVGMITQAPGANAALLGTGVNSNNQINHDNNTDLVLNSDTTTNIENNINASSTSGDATVSNNTQAGNASTGDARTDVNIFNMANSTLSVDNWFGVLYLNIFGDWSGSFGIDTAFGNIPPTTERSSTATPQPKQTRNHNEQTSQLSSTAATTSNNLPTQPAALVLAQNTTNEASDDQGQMLDPAQDSKTVASNDSGNTQVKSATDSIAANQFNSLPFIGGIIAVSLIGGERIYSRRLKG